MKSLFFPFYLIFVITFLCYVALVSNLNFFSLDAWEEEYNIKHQQAFVDVVNEITKLSSLNNAENYFRAAFESRNFTIETIPLEKLHITSEELKQLKSTGVYFPESEFETAYFLLKHSTSAFYVVPDEHSLFWVERDTKEAWDGLLLLGSLAVIIFVLLVFLNYRFKRLEETCERFGKGEFNTRVKTGWRYDVGNLNRVLNQMAAKIFLVQEQKKYLVRAVAHELRTPIFRLQCQLDLLSETQDKQEQTKFVEGAHQDLNELNDMVEELLTYAKLESDQLEVALEPVDINCYLDREVEYLQFESAIPISFSGSDSLLVNMNKKQMSRALSNIIRNGLRYAKSHVWVTLTISSDSWKIDIENDGPRISKEDELTIFDPFVRLDASRDRDTGGHGLGLSIAKTIVLQHNGDITVTSEGTSGVRFTLTFPH